MTDGHGAGSPSAGPGPGMRFSMKRIAFNYTAAMLFSEALTFIMLFVVLLIVVKVSDMADAALSTCLWLAFLIMLIRIPLSLTWLWIITAPGARELARTGHVSGPPLSGKYGWLISDLANLLETAIAAGIVFAVHSFSIAKVVTLTAILAIASAFFSHFVLERGSRKRLAVSRGER
jgi:hypothetical protein